LPRHLWNEALRTSRNLGVDFYGTLAHRLAKGRHVPSVDCDT
jgi:hypothetical protein